MAGKKKRPDSFLKIVFVVVSIILILRLLGSFFPENRVWGFNHAGYSEGLFLIYPIFLIACFWIYFQGLRRETIWPGGLNPPINVFKSASIYIILLVSAAGFYFFSVDAHFLGDGHQLLAQLSDPTLTLKSESFGDMKIHQLLSRLIGDADSRMSLYLSFKYIAVSSGMIYTLSLLHYGRKIAGSMFGYFAFVLINLLAANTILFYGYVETYSPVTAFIFLFFISAVSSIKNGRGAVVPVLAFLAALFFHKITIIFLPALLIYAFIILGREKSTRRILSGQKWILIIMAVLAVVFYGGIIITAPLSIKKIFLSPAGGSFTTDGYFLLAPKHIIDYLNLIIFLAPLPVMTLLFIYMRSNKEVSGGLKAALWFILTGAFIGAMAAFIIEPKLGMARDWDLFSTMLIPAQLAGACLWLNYFENHERFQPATIMIVIMLLSIFIPWLALNNSEKGLYRYALDIMKQDPKHGRTGLYTMIPYQEENGNQIEADRLKRYCALSYPEMEMVRQSEKMLFEGDLDQGIKLADEAIAENPGFFRGYQLKAKFQLNMGRYEQALENFKIADALNPYNSDNNYFTGVVYQRLGDTVSALKYFRRGMSYDALNPFPAIEVADYFSARAQLDSARFYFRSFSDTVKIFPPNLYYKFGLRGLIYGDTSRAIQFFDRYLKAGNNPELMEEVSKIKGRLIH